MFGIAVSSGQTEASCFPRSKVASCYRSPTPTCPGTQWLSLTEQKEPALLFGIRLASSGGFQADFVFSCCLVEDMKKLFRLLLPGSRATRGIQPWCRRQDMAREPIGGTFRVPAQERCTCGTEYGSHVLQPHRCLLLLPPPGLPGRPTPAPQDCTQWEAGWTARLRRTPALLSRAPGWTWGC